jgi:hypothetical protein
MNRTAAANYNPTHIVLDGISYTAWDADLVIHASHYEPNYKLGHRLSADADLAERCRKVHKMKKDGIKLKDACSSCMVTQGQYKAIYQFKKPKVKFNLEYYLKHKDTLSRLQMATNTHMSYSGFCRCARNYEKGVKDE